MSDCEPTGEVAGLGTQDRGSRVGEETVRGGGTDIA